jgi:hypothetical protein
MNFPPAEVAMDQLWVEGEPVWMVHTIAFPEKGSTEEKWDAEAVYLMVPNWRSSCSAKVLSAITAQGLQVESWKLDNCGEFFKLKKVVMDLLVVEGEPEWAMTTIAFPEKGSTEWDAGEVFLRMTKEEGMDAGAVFLMWPSWRSSCSAKVVSAITAHRVLLRKRQRQKSQTKREKKKARVEACAAAPAAEADVDPFLALIDSMDVSIARVEEARLARQAILYASRGGKANPKWRKSPARKKTTVRSW